MITWIFSKQNIHCFFMSKSVLRYTDKKFKNKLDKLSSVMMNRTLFKDIIKSQ